MSDKFWVHWIDIDGGDHREPIKDAEGAVGDFARIVRGPGRVFVKEARLIDMGDCTNMEWLRSKGLTYPTDNPELTRKFPGVS